MTARVLITGATGFVGSHIAERFAAAGHRLRCTVRSTSDTRWMEGVDTERVLLDLEGADRRLEDVFRDVDLVVHAAGITRASVRGDYMRINADGSERLLRAAASAGVRRFVFVSSLAARGPDGYSGPVSPYGWSKRVAEEKLRACGGPTEVVVLRPAGVYGPRDAELLPLFRMAMRGWLPAPRSGSPIQPVYVEDVARATLLAAEGGADFGPHPVAAPRRYSWREAARLFGAAVGRRVRLVTLPGAAFEAAGCLLEAAALPRRRAPRFDRRRARDLARYGWTCDVGPTEAALSWRAEVDLPEGLARTAAWYRERDWLSD